MLTLIVFMKKLFLQLIIIGCTISLTKIELSLWPDLWKGDEAVEEESDEEEESSEDGEEEEESESESGEDTASERSGATPGTIWPSVHFSA